jgi:hypothetical protein
MTTTFIDTTSCTRVKLDNLRGEVAEILNEELCGAKNALGMLRWLDNGERFDAQPQNRHQLIYLMEGGGTITLEGKDYPVAKGAGVYLGPAEGASITHSGSIKLKLFHLVVRNAGNDASA